MNETDYSDAGFWMPTQASDFAESVDSLFSFILWLSIFFFILLMWLTAHFAWKYRQRSETQRTSPLKHNFRLEFLWSAVPTVLLVVIFAWGFTDFTALSATPRDAVDVRVIGAQWNWNVSYPQLDRECTPEPGHLGTQHTTFYLPVNRPFTVQLSAEDVLHSFWIPAFRVKMDALPNRYTGFTVTPTKTGTFMVYCAEYCGTNHSRMTATVEVLSDEEWAAWLSPEDERCRLDPDAPDYGERLFIRYGCAGCHSVTPDRAPRVGPGLYGLPGRAVDIVGRAEPIIADDNYIRESIEYPERMITAGFAGQNMPAFRGRLSEQELGAIIDYIKSLDRDDGDDAPAPTDDGNEE